ncbi:M23 family metallopeptidase [Effusibacillus lacus]|uniref:M23ase beta-sheet core domain-containing protein n=1 Tax=Effusibacillus lacus TaxID=1348429 RepID=A0A292YDQ7_9BACL|nr:M23 family metallopeptidase [Effusibacillus lacus]TCS76504.1 peptidase M23-like protein [Effusibacillus lacus]GAX90472.1 hypothetical protein EFBL_2099 [Effusibacillus lacus]
MSKLPNDDLQDPMFPPPSHPVFQGIREQEGRAGSSRPYFRGARTEDRGYGYYGRPGSSRWDGPWGAYRGYKQYDDYEERENSRIVGQIIGAVLLLLISYVSVHSSHPLAERAQQVLKTVMTRETDFSTVTNWMATHLGASNLSIPVSGKPSEGEEMVYVLPLTDFKVTASFDANQHPAVLLETSPGSEVRTVAKGEVKTYDKNDKYGIYVIVEHGGDAGQTLYGNLESASVKPGDWVYTGQVIGKTGKQVPSDLYFAHYVKNRPVDPQGILDRARR